MARTTIKHILVTGGAGFIGSHVTELLCNKGYQVTVIDDLSFGYKHFVDKRAEFVNGSLNNKNLLDQLLEQVDAVVHLAASSIISLSYKTPQSYYENNVMNGINLLEAMRKNNVKKIIFSSTAAVYGVSQKQPIKEDFPKKPISIYGSSKLAFEEALLAYHKAFGIESTSLRYFNAYGPRDEQQPATRAMPIWIKAIIADKPLPLYWDGKQLRDYVYVKDIALAHLAVLPLSGCNVYNIGSGKGIYMKDILTQLEKISGKKIKIAFKKQRQGDPPELVADITKIRNEVGWKPQTLLEDGLKDTFAYYANMHRTNL